jgi:anti-sigma B factor antagonist
MTINETVRGDVRVLAPGGRLTVETEAVFSTAVRRAFAAGRMQLVLDLAGVPYVDSCGLGVMIQAYVAACRRGGSVKLANVNGRNRRLLTITRLLTVFDVFENAEEAIRSFGREAADDQRPDEARNLSTTAMNAAGISSLG